MKKKFKLFKGAAKTLIATTLATTLAPVAGVAFAEEQPAATASAEEVVIEDDANPLARAAVTISDEEVPLGRRSARIDDEQTPLGRRSAPTISDEETPLGRRATPEIRDEEVPLADQAGVKSQETSSLMISAVAGSVALVALSAAGVLFFRRKRSAQK